jgi:hypothetical protein
MDEKGFRIGEIGSEKVVIMRRNPDRKDGYAGGSRQSKLLVTAWFTKHSVLF